MSKTNELSMQLDELKRCGEILIGISDSLKELFSGNEETQPTLFDEKPKEQEAPIDFIEVRKILTEKSRDGHTAEIKALLSKFGACKLSDVKPEDYRVLLKEAEAF